LGIPHYFDVIPRENARDLQTIKSKLDKGVYQSAEQVHQDMEMMFGNAYKFNGRESPVAALAASLEESWKRLYNKAKNTTAGPVVKKPRYG
jgi:transcription initiation factor TFIID subunit 2